jgi:hypothetical protein
MSSTLTIPPGEHGVLRLFSINLPESEISAFTDEQNNGAAGTDSWPLLIALGARTLDSNFVEVFPLSDLGDYGLPKYLIEGNGIPAAQVDPMRQQLGALHGHVLIVFSSAFGGATDTLSPKAPLVHVATFFEDASAVKFEQLPDESAQPTIPNPAKQARKTPSDAAIGGRVAVVALLVAFAITALMVWIGG